MSELRVLMKEVSQFLKMGVPQVPTVQLSSGLLLRNLN